MAVVDVASSSDDLHQSRIRIETLPNDEGFFVRKTDAQGSETSLGTCLSSAVVMAKVRMDVVENLDIDPNIKKSFCFEPQAPSLTL